MKKRTILFHQTVSCFHSYLRLLSLILKTSSVAIFFNQKTLIADRLKLSPEEALEFIQKMKVNSF